MADPQAPAFAPALLERLPGPPRKVAVLRASRIGDFLCAVPAFRAVRRALPEAELTLITLPMLQGLAVRCRHFDRYVAFPGYPGIADQLFEPARALGFFAAMQKERFDLAIQMQGSGVNANPFLLMLGARATAGFVRPGDGPGRLDAALPLPNRGHEITRVLALPRFLGMAEQGEGTEFPLRDADHQAADKLVRGLPVPLIGLHFASHEPARRWPLERFGHLGRLLQARHGGTLLLLGAAEEQAQGQRLAALLGRHCCNLVARTSLPVLGAVIARLNLLISSDSGPAHIGYALGTPTITVFRRGGSLRYGPPRLGPYRAVEPRAGPSPHLVGVGQVQETADELLSERVALLA